jgi:hypothetical protein
MQLELIQYQGWENCIRLSNGLVELVTTTEIGPRIIRFGFVGDVNEFLEAPADLGNKGGDTWRGYGGHRLWHSPEMDGRTNLPDNSPIQYELKGDYFRTIQLEASLGIQKEMEIRMAPDSAQVEVRHTLRNCGLWDVEFAVWALSVMRHGGVAIVPLPPRKTHPEALLPVSTLTLWAYTELSDPRWVYGKRFVMLNQDPKATTPQKMGAMVPAGWLAYANAGHLFVKHVPYVPGAVYPDWNSSMEVFTNSEIIELESLSPVVKLAPGESAEHVETWNLYKNVPQPVDEAGVIQHVEPLAVQ